ncbi:hypothetical protein, partial [Aromatoleum evansii]|uniref:hypothetical protein n=1 Tax=Aromatoleum evansii TaxID=59406 RepID=UPI00145F3D75
MKKEATTFCGGRLRIANLLSSVPAIEMAARRIPEGSRDRSDQWLDILRKMASDPLMNAKNDGMTCRVREPRSEDVPNTAAQHKLIVPLAFPQNGLWKTFGEHDPACIQEWRVWIERGVVLDVAGFEFGTETAKDSFVDRTRRLV